ncbi:MAG: hypothetical protein LC104_17950 [Bacteroidales bacterium]|nr:hypothetical protein [Bacteroidales bacterium]
MPRFVILEHDWPERHWDLLLEVDTILKAWRLREEPQCGRRIPAEPNHDHRRLYLDYEGPISGDRGSVTRWDTGEYEQTTTGIILRGGKLNGIADWQPEEKVWIFWPEN